ncbi:MAG: peptide chain release factor N(5)-glutamine methyltransferase [Spirochaetales bacterium]|nr:peptide chain release factor N(5)-glutamine methyltransferase [Spirochaetales bacterium]
MLYYAEVETPMLDSIVLLAEAVGMTKEKLYASFTHSIEEGQYGRFREFLHDRCSGVPVSYICRRKEFYGKEFFVDPRVLVPRPDTEILVDYAFSLVKTHGYIRNIHDACTGSGCIAITIQTLLPEAAVSASDISGAAKEVFEENCRRILGQGAGIPFFVSDLLAGVKGTYDMIVSNPPYLTDRETSDLKKIGWPEPELALRGGTDGTEPSRRLIRQAPQRLAAGGYLVLESAPPHMDVLRLFMEKNGFTDIAVVCDLGQRPRVIAGRLAAGRQRDE